VSKKLKNINIAVELFSNIHGIEIKIHLSSTTLDSLTKEEEQLGLG